MNLRKSGTESADLPIWLRASASQLAGAVLAGAVFVVLVRTGGPPPPLALALLAGLAAAAVGHRLLHLPPWWIAIHTAFPPALLLAAGAEAPGWIYGMLFIVSLLVFWNTLRDRVPLYLTNPIAARAAAELAEGIAGPDGEARRFCDLGSGPGGFAIRVAQLLPEWQVIGVETSPALFAFAALRRCLGGPANVRFRRDDIWRTDLGAFDAVYAFLSPAPMERLFDKARNEMRPGSLFVSNSFAVPGVEPDDIIEVEDSRRTQLLIWRM